MVLLVVVPMGIVNRRISRQLELNAAEEASVVDASLPTKTWKGSGQCVAVALLNVPNEPRFKAVLKLSDPKTLAVLLKELAEESDGDFILFGQSQRELIAVQPPASVELQRGGSTG
ncbi:MAG: hypothetical protein U1G07_02745 [Verrucomicrobiota bacterium]